MATQQYTHSGYVPGVFAIQASAAQFVLLRRTTQ